MKMYEYFTKAAFERLRLIRFRFDTDRRELDEDIRRMQQLAIKYGFEWDRAPSGDGQRP